MWEQTLKNCSNLINWVIIGPLWVKYGAKTAYQPPAVQNPGNAHGLYLYIFIYIVKVILDINCSVFKKKNCAFKIMFIFSEP